MFLSSAAILDESRDDTLLVQAPFYLEFKLGGLTLPIQVPPHCPTPPHPSPPSPLLSRPPLCLRLGVLVSAEACSRFF